MEITSRSKLLDVLKAYPFLEEQIVEIAPPFKNLRNPILRRTVGQLATIEQVAQIGNIDVVDLVNTPAPGCRSSRARPRRRRALHSRTRQMTTPTGSAARRLHGRWGPAAGGRRGAA